MPRTFSLSTRTGSRSSNQDRACAKHAHGITLVVLADGMGGHANGDLAAIVAVDAAWKVLHRQMQHLALKLRPAEAIPAAERAMRAAARAVCKLGGGYRAPGSTLIIGILWPTAALFASTGDSPAYVNGRMITRGHNVGHCLLSQVASLEMVEYHTVEHEPGDTIVIASDGLDHDLVIAGIRGAEALVQAQIKRGKENQDNVTVFTALSRPASDPLGPHEVTDGMVPMATGELPGAAAARENLR